MEPKLKNVVSNYLKYIRTGVNKKPAAELAINTEFHGQTVKPHLHLDHNEDASHVFHNGHVLFFDNCKIYKSE